MSGLRRTTSGVLAAIVIAIGASSLPTAVVHAVCQTTNRCFRDTGQCCTTRCCYLGGGRFDCYQVCAI